MGQFLPIISALGSALGAVSSISSLFGGGKKDSAPAAPQAPPTFLADVPKKADPRQAQDRSRRRAAAAVGRGKTVLTSPLGLGDDQSTARTTLLVL